MGKKSSECRVLRYSTSCVCRRRRLKCTVSRALCRTTVMGTQKRRMNAALVAVLLLLAVSLMPGRQGTPRQVLLWAERPGCSQAATDCGMHSWTSIQQSLTTLHGRSCHGQAEIGGKRAREQEGAGSKVKSERNQGSVQAGRQAGGQAGGRASEECTSVLACLSLTNVTSKGGGADWASLIATVWSRGLR